MPCGYYPGHSTASEKLCAAAARPNVCRSKISHGAARLYISAVKSLELEHWPTESWTLDEIFGRKVMQDLLLQ